MSSRLQMARRKYGNRRTIVDGITFASQREAKRFRELGLLERAGEITELELQPRFPIAIGGVAVKYPSGRQLTYVADFMYRDVRSGSLVVEDAKGMRTPAYKIKRALVAAMGIDIREV